MSVPQRWAEMLSALIPLPTIVLINLLSLTFTSTYLSNWCIGRMDKPDILEPHSPVRSLA
jgi:hypothetical protein